MLLLEDMIAPPFFVADDRMRWWNGEHIKASAQRNWPRSQLATGRFISAVLKREPEPMALAI
ncbi:MAG: hypothetical protein GY759_10120 [Chloroflexi bacterium]|nr:hypothetical protein [Chloroflexota bacterium]